MLRNECGGAGHMRRGHRGSRRPVDIIARYIGEDVLSGCDDEIVPDLLVQIARFRFRNAAVAGTVGEARNLVARIYAADDQQTAELIRLARVIFPFDADSVVPRRPHEHELVPVIVQHLKFAPRKGVAGRGLSVAHVDCDHLPAQGVDQVDVVERLLSLVISHPTVIVEERVTVDARTRRHAHDSVIVCRSGRRPRHMRAVKVGNVVITGIAPE